MTLILYIHIVGGTKLIPEWFVKMMYVALEKTDS
jgi:hypothetical protein